MEIKALQPQKSNTFRGIITARIAANKYSVIYSGKSIRALAPINEIFEIGSRVTIMKAGTDYLILSLTATRKSLRTEVIVDG